MRLFSLRPDKPSLSSSNGVFKELASMSTHVGVTIGNFDGVHLGHQELFTTLKQKNKACASGAKIEAINILVSFFPHPRVVLGKVSKETQDSEKQYWSLTPLRAKSELARRYGFDYFYPIRFRKSFSELSPEQFVTRYLVEAVKAKLVVVGYDWSFGKGQAGNTETLEGLGSKYGFECEVVSPFLVGENRVSSSLIRGYLERGEVREVESFLGRRFSVCGEVVEGDKRGRTIGFPTANIEPARQLLPMNGVYATTLSTQCGISLPAVTNVGVRPSFDGDAIKVETHAFSGTPVDLYGKRVEISFLDFLRAEKKFASIEELKTQIAIDCERAQAIDLL